MGDSLPELWKAGIGMAWPGLGTVGYWINDLNSLSLGASHVEWGYCVCVLGDLLGGLNERL